MKKIWNYIVDHIVDIVVVLGCIYLGFGFYYTRTQLDKQEKEYITPVEESRIDTLYITRDSLIYRTKYLDSIKHDTIEKVYNLDDSTTLQLFLQLVSE
jgi:uncharacterized membrane protein YpjA